MSPQLHSLSSLPQPFHAASDAWDLALLTARDNAKNMYPSEVRLIDKGYRLILAGAVLFHRDHAVVQSQSDPGKSYKVVTDCQCQWVTYGRGEGQRRRCAHRWAYLLYSHAVDHLTRMWAATYTTTDDDGGRHAEYGFATVFPEDSGHLFVDARTGAHRFLPAPNVNLVLHGKCAWYEEGVLVGMLAQALLDMQPR